MPNSAKIPPGGEGSLSPVSHPAPVVVIHIRQSTYMLHRENYRTVPLTNEPGTAFQTVRPRLAIVASQPLRPAENAEERG